MRKRVFGRHLKRDTNERKALFKNLMTELVLHEKISTTEEKAKSIRGQVEKLITKAKRKGQASEYLLQPYVSSEAVKKIISELAIRFATRPGGYTRIIKLGNRFNDNASMVIIELVDKKEVEIKKQDVSPEDLDLSAVEQEIQEAEIVTEAPKKKVVKVKKETKEKKEPKEKKEKVSKEKKEK
jgi:large subunit ribosomal protein L17